MAVVTTHKTKIDEFEYVTETFPATEGLELIGSLGGILFSDVQTLSPVGQLIMEIGDDENPEASARALLATPGVVAALAGAVMRQAQVSGGLALLAKQILGRTTCENMKVGEVATSANVAIDAFFDEHFAGRYTHLFKLCCWVVVKSLNLPFPVSP